MSKYRDMAEGFRKGQESRPDYVTDEHLEYLDELRKSGVTNMLGAIPYLLDAFDELNREKATAVLSYWMKTFRKPTR